VTGVQVLDLATGATTDLRIPRLGAFVFSAGGFLAKDGSAYVALGRQLWRLSATAAPVRVGPGLPGGSLFGRRGDVLFMDNCGTASILDLRAPHAWSTVARDECNATLSPDGRTIAFTPNGRRGVVVAQPVDGSAPPRTIVDLTGNQALATLGLGRRNIFGLQWGKPGLAMMVGSGSFGPSTGAAVVFRSNIGRVQVVPIGSSQPGFLQWQPGGNLLAFSDCVQCFAFNRGNQYSDIRVLDGRSGHLAQIASGQNDAFFSTVWSPDGRYLATRRGSGQLAVYDARGDLIRTFVADAVSLDSWDGQIAGAPGFG
jgi:hypothetical protein